MHLEPASGCRRPRTESNPQRDPEVAEQVGLRAQAARQQGGAAWCFGGGGVAAHL